MLYMRKRLVMKMTGLIVCASMIFTTAGVLQYRPVKAVTRDFMAYDPTQGDIDNAKKQRDEAQRKANEANEKVQKLKHCDINFRIRTGNR